ncbi:MAG: hypothetical protein RR276_04760, partial [Angelakisella sp.]
MKKMFKRLAAGLAVTMLMLPVVASASATIPPGEVVGFGYSEFVQKGNTAYCIDGRAPLTNANFTITKKTFARGANLVDSIRINDRDREVQVIFASNIAIQAPASSPNVIISELTLKATKTLRVSGDVILKNGDLYTYGGGDLEFRVGSTLEELDVGQNSVVQLTDGDSKSVKWTDTGKLTVDYGNIAVGECMVYPGDKVLYYYSAEVPFALQTANTSAYIESLN